MSNKIVRATLAISLFLSAACAPSPDAPTEAQLKQSVIDRLPVMMDAYGVDGMIVVAVSGQETLLSTAYGQTKDGTPFTTDTACPLYSATKVFTSLTIASLVEDGEFDVNTTLSEYLDDVPDAWATIPFWRLLNHTSGIPMIVDKPVFQALAENPQSGTKDIIDIVRKLPLDYTPGEFSRYRQSGYAVAEMILSEKLNAEWPSIVAQHVTGPANASDTVYRDMFTSERKTSLLSSAGGFQTTSQDIANIFKTLNRNEIVSTDFLESWLFDSKHNFDGYSLGSVLVDVEGLRTLGHSGGGRANIRYASQKKVGVMVCTDDTKNNNIMHDVANMLMKEIALKKNTLMPIQTLLYDFEETSAAQIISSYQAAQSVSPHAYDFSGTENSFNQIGYGMLADGKLSDAIEMFEFNVREYPQSANAYDSLGEALFKSGNYKESLENYNKALELAPDNQNAAMMIKKITAGSKQQP